jgi:hypothetical protein
MKKNNFSYISNPDSCYLIPRFTPPQTPIVLSQTPALSISYPEKTTPKGEKAISNPDPDPKNISNPDVSISNPDPVLIRLNR